MTKTAAAARDRRRPANDAVLTTVMVELLSMRTRLSRGLARTHDARKLYAVDAKGDRSSAIIRKMSAYKFLGIATSAIWNAT